MKNPYIPNLLQRIKAAAKAAVSRPYFYKTFLVSLGVIPLIVLIAVSQRQGDEMAPTSAPATATTASSMSGNPTLTAASTDGNNTGTYTMTGLTQGQEKSKEIFGGSNTPVRQSLAKTLSASAAEQATRVSALLESAQLISLSELEKAAASGQFTIAWIDDKSSAVLLEPKPADVKVDPKKNASSRKTQKPAALTDIATGSNTNGPKADAKADATQPLLSFYPATYGPQLLDVLAKQKLQVIVGPSFELATADSNTPWFLWIILSIVAFYIIRGWHRSRNGWTPAGSHTAKSTEGGEIPDTRFTDVAGVDEAIEEMRELVAFLKEPEKFAVTGAKPPRGALMSGPPGTGKTLLARAVAGEAGVPFYAVAGSDFVEMYVGVGARRVRDLFAKAKKANSAIVFIDEIDAVARKRGNQETGGGSAETENTLIALLSEMDGFAGTNVIVLAATNRADMLDPAITRPGRLDRKIVVGTPDRRGRQRILEVHSKGRPIAQDVDYVMIARRTPGMSGAELALVVNEACLEATRRNLSIVDAGCFDAAIATIAMGRARTSALVTDSDRELTAWHEAGHTICALLQEDADDPVSVSIVPRGPAGGVTWMSGNDDIFLPKDKALARLVTSLGGRRIIKKLLDASYTQGAHGDLDAATNLAMAMATQYGMTRLGLMVRSPQMLAASGMHEVNEVVEELLNDALIEARALLAANADLVEAVVVELLDKETLIVSEINEIRDRVIKARAGRGPVQLLDDDEFYRDETVTGSPKKDSSEEANRTRPSGATRSRRVPLVVHRPRLESVGRLLEGIGKTTRRAARRPANPKRSGAGA